MSRHPNELFWTRYAAGDIGFMGRLRLAGHLKKCVLCQQEQQQLLAEKQEFDAAPQRLGEIAQLKSTAIAAAAGNPRSSRLNRSWLLLGAPTLAAATAAILLMVVPARHRPDLRAKGSEAFILFTVKHPDAAPAALGDTCHPGDHVRAQFESEKPYVMVLGMDATGTTQILHPMGGERSTRVHTGPQLTPGSWILDEQLGMERFIAVFSDTMLDRSGAMEALRQHDIKPATLPGLSIKETRCHKVQR